MKKKVTLCFSGGIDSTSLIHYYQEREFVVEPVHFDYGQSSLEGEKNASSAISHFYNLAIESVSLRPTIPILHGTEYAARNALLILSALAHSRMLEGLVALGIHEGTEYYDASANFLVDMQSLLDGYYNGSIILEAPFIEFSKEDIINYAREAQVPLHLTYSCDVNSRRACGNCDSCKDRQEYGLD